MPDPITSVRGLIAVVLGGGRGTRLLPLTKYRAKPAVPLAGKYRLIDIPLSNCINSGINRIYVLTQFLSVSLHRHIRQTYRFDPFSGGFVEILAAQQTMDGVVDWYQGTADAVRKQLQYLEQPWIRNVLILSGDQLYRMDYRDMLATHVRHNADVTIAGLPVHRKDAPALGLMVPDREGRVLKFVEKPQTDPEIDAARVPPGWIEVQGITGQGRECLASMGIYLFNRQLLIERLRATTHQDFGREVFPALLNDHNVRVHLFDGYWEDIGTIRAFYEANLALTGLNPPFQLATAEATIYSRARFLPPSKIEGASVHNSLIADGCRIGSGTTIENSVIGNRCIIGQNVTIRSSVLMGADEYETEAERTQNLALRRPRIGIEDGAVIIGAIVDKNCRIGRNARVENIRGIENREADAVYGISDGIPVIVRGATLPDGWTLG